MFLNETCLEDSCSATVLNETVYQCKQVSLYVKVYSPAYTSFNILIIGHVLSDKISKVFYFHTHSETLVRKLKQVRQLENVYFYPP